VIRKSQQNPVTSVPFRGSATKESVMIVRYALHGLRHAVASLCIEQGWSRERVWGAGSLRHHKDL
jgi:hypothetical protein